MSGESPRPIDELVARADEILNAASQVAVTVRLMGGVAIRIRARNLGGIDPLRRRYHDIDLVGRLSDVRAIDGALTGLGYEPDREVNTQFGTMRRVYHHSSGFHVDLFFERLEFCHTIRLAGRLDLVPRTLAPADLLLQKLQIVERNEKDLVDVYWLLLNHELVLGDPAQLELDRLTALTGADWGLHTTALDFLDHARQHLPQAGLLPDARDELHNTLARLGAALVEAPKSVRWRARDRIGRRMRWYRVVEEVL